MLRTRFHPTTLHFLYYSTEQHIFTHAWELGAGVVTTPFTKVTGWQNSKRARLSYYQNNNNNNIIFMRKSWGEGGLTSKRMEKPPRVTAVHDE